MHTDHKSHIERQRTALTGGRIEYYGMSLERNGLNAILYIAQCIVSKNIRTKIDLEEELSQEFPIVCRNFIRQLVSLLVGDDGENFPFRQDRYGILHSRSMT